MVTKKPATSSITTSEGSGVPNISWVRCEAQIATIVMATSAKAPYQTPNQPRTKMRGTAAKVPNVPGITGAKPEPHHVDKIRAILP